ncbi:MAG TPA: hypothetical protein DG355_08895, partial [Candidatus Cloacimonas sp.]|nr:hypothetical protein [Candidatus Cloacimonas sp.]
MKSKTASISLTALAAPAIVLLSLSLGIFLQMQSLSFVLKGLGFMGFWITFLLLRGITLPRMLMMVSTIYLLPMEIAFYFSLGMLILVLVADFRHIHQWKLQIPYPASFFIL